MSDIIVDEVLKLVKSNCLQDWYTIERAAHDGREWWQPEPYGRSFQMSARISDACIEGSLEEMKLIAKAIRSRDKFESRRCAVYVENDRAFFFSPRNSRKHASVPLEFADKLAEEIENT